MHNILSLFGLGTYRRCCVDHGIALPCCCHRLDLFVGTTSYRLIGGCMLPWADQGFHRFGYDRTDKERGGAPTGTWRVPNDG